MNEFEKIKRENEIMRRYLDVIYTLGFDRDGFTRAEDLGSLVDELTHYAQLGLECNTEEPMSTNEGIKYNILDEVLYYSKEKIEELVEAIEYCKKNGIWADKPVMMPLFNAVCSCLVKSDDEYDVAEHLLDSLELDNEDKN